MRQIRVTPVNEGYLYTIYITFKLYILTIKSKISFIFIVSLRLIYLYPRYTVGSSRITLVSKWINN